MNHRNERNERGYREDEQGEGRRTWPAEDGPEHGGREQGGRQYFREHEEQGYGGERRYGGERGGERGYGGERGGERGYGGGERGGERHYGGERAGERGYGRERAGERGYGGERAGERRYGGERGGERGGYGGERGGERRYGGERGGYGMGRSDNYGSYGGYGAGREETYGGGRGWGMGRGYQARETYEGSAYQPGEPEEWRAPGIERRGRERGWRMGDVYGGGYGLYGREEQRIGERRGYRGRGPRNYARSDERICEEVCDLLCVSDEVDASDLEVTVENGEVRLSGRVEDREEKYAAEDLAASVSGVKDVNNQIRVQPPSATIEGRSEQSQTAFRTEEGEETRGGTAVAGESIRTTAT